MRVGLVARADKTGLGIQTWTFAKNMRPDSILVVDLSHCSGQKPDLSLYRGHPDVAVWHDRMYPDPTPRQDDAVDAFLEKVDVVFTAETPYNWYLIQRARQLGVRTIIQPNFEFLEHMVLPHLPEPDVFAMPSMWRFDEIKQRLPGRDVRYVPVPVDRELLPFRQRDELKTILHTAGTPATEDRNGSLLLIEAMKYVRTPVRAMIRTQKHLPGVVPGNVTVNRAVVPNFWDLYGDEDLYVMPRKFGGLCLPMQEALSVGMPVLMTDIDPNHHILPSELLVRATRTKEFMARAMIGVHEVTPEMLAERIDWLYEHPEDFAALSRWADEWATEHSWDALAPTYRALLEGTDAEPRDEPTISVVVATYGDESVWNSLAERAINSLRTQTMAPHEIIRCHGTTLADARNRAAARATGGWLLFLDADDTLDEHYVEAMTKAITRLSEDDWLLQPATLGLYPNGDRDATANVIPPRGLTLRQGNHMVIGTVVRRSTFERSGGFWEWAAMEDWCLWLRCTELGATPIPVPEAIYQVMVTAGSRNGNVPRNLFGQILSRHDTWKQYVKESA